MVNNWFIPPIVVRILTGLGLPAYVTLRSFY
jgi:hypothetical protein